MAHMLPSPPTQPVRLEQSQLLRILGEQPMAVATLAGPEHVFTFANSRYLALVGNRPVLGAPVAEALPDATEQGFVALLDQVYRSGEPFVGTDIAILLDQVEGGPPRQLYLTFTYQPLRDEQGLVSGILVTAVDVTEQVLARKQQSLLQQAEVERAQRQAQQRHEWLGLLAHAPLAVALLREPDHRLDYWNDLFDELFPGARPGATFAEALPDLATAEALRELDRLYQDGDRYEGTTMRVPGNGQPGAPARYVIFTYQAYREQGHIVGVAIFAQEVTQQELGRQQVEQLNRELEQRVAERTRQAAAAQAEAERQRGELGRVFEQAPVAIAIFRGPAHVIELANELHLALWGRTAAQVLGRPLFEALPEAAGQGYEELLAGVLSTGQPYVAQELSAPLVRNGVAEEVFFNFVYQPLYEADGHISGVVVVAHDTTEQVRSRRQVEQLNQELEIRVQERTQQLHEQQQLITSVFEQAPAGVWVVQGRDYVFELYNPQMSRVLGPTPQQALGRPYFDVLPELLSQGIPELLRRVWEEGETVVIEEYPAQLNRHASGEVGYFTFTFQPLRDLHGRVTRIGCVALDVTSQVLARRQVQDLNQQLTVANQELHTSNTRLRHSNADLDTFVYTASHDLKAPITNLAGLLQVLQQDAPADGWGATADQVLRLMRDAVARFNETLGHLTDVTRLEFDAAPAAPVEVAPVIAGVELDLAPLLAVAQARVTVDVAACPTLRVAAKTVRSVVYNLLSNALKYRAAGRVPTVHIQCRCQGDEVQLSVTDNGLGMDLARQKELFQMFRRYHTHVEGAGVGLYMVKRLVEHAGGRITVQSQPGAGSTFTVAFPRLAE